MAESAAASILQPVVDEVVKDAAAVVKRQFNYLCCFTSNINGMEIEAKTLDDATRGVQGEVERERENAQDIVPAVETWLTDSNDFKGKVDGILSEVPNIKSGCLRVTGRYSLSKKAMILRLCRILKGNERVSNEEVDGGFVETNLQYVNLRYLKYGARHVEQSVVSIFLPSSISLFWNLQTLIVSFTSIIAPNEIWEMIQLRNLEVNNGLHLPDPPPSDQGRGFVMRNLHTLKVVENLKFSEEHRQKVKEFERISHPKPPAATVPIPSVGATYEFESRKQIEEKIMTILKGDERGMIGIYGMGGLGKTFMANKIRNRALKEHMFDEVVMAVVSQQVDESKIQLQIADQLGLKFSFKLLTNWLEQSDK